ncbi:unnamed protein product [Pieris macdunnoughi]|uniref:Uncharacterized protein n=1 Tax=Pieris macdunnoughi TaxID=345717 RepID=A0A821RDX8_9NEOP|nr:unnamed protein product [Pieris macdunnoughi]
MPSDTRISLLEYKRRSTLRDSQTETDISLLRAASAVSVASGATDRSGNTDNCVEEYVCDVPFAGKFSFKAFDGYCFTNSKSKSEEWLKSFLVVPQ